MKTIVVFFLLTVIYTTSSDSRHNMNITSWNTEIPPRSRYVF